VPRKGWCDKLDFFGSRSGGAKKNPFFSTISSKRRLFFSLPEKVYTKPIVPQMIKNEGNKGLERERERGGGEREQEKRGTKSLQSNVSFEPV
jgi:hypothetical protein